MSRFAKVLIIVPLLLFAFESILLFTSGPVVSRVHLLNMKLSGQIPHWKWTEVFQFITPSNMRPHRYAPLFLYTDAYMRVPVREKQVEPGCDCDTLWETPMGEFWARNNEAPLLAHLVEEQLSEAVYNRPPVAVRSGDVVIDGGAHIGTFTRFALSKGAQKVIAFEPDSRNIECFKKNFPAELANGRVILVPEALWSSAGTVRFASGANSAQSKIPRSKARSSIEIAATTLDKVVSAINLDRVDFIKMDIEGAEWDALKGAEECIRRFSPRMAICIYHIAGDPVRITELILRTNPNYWMFADRAQAYYYNPSIH